MDCRQKFPLASLATIGPPEIRRSTRAAGAERQDHQRQYVGEHQGHLVGDIDTAGLDPMLKRHGGAEEESGEGDA